MKNPQSQTLFHVSKFETILAILADKGFKTSYCIEEIRHGFNRENKGCISYHYYIPMISFTDMPLSSVLKGESTYGDCAIGLKIEWAKKNGLNPVLYIEKDSKISRSIWKLLDDLKQEGISKNLNLAATVLMQSIKNYDGNYKNRPITYYDEREWRYIPELNVSKYPSYIYMDDCDKLNSLGQKPHISENEYLLTFTEKDIDYIIIDNKNRKKELIERLSQIGLNDLRTKIKIRKPRI